jgi:hypothetical protein
MREDETPKRTRTGIITPMPWQPRSSIESKPLVEDGFPAEDTDLRRFPAPDMVDGIEVNDDEVTVLSRLFEEALPADNLVVPKEMQEPVDERHSSVLSSAPLSVGEHLPEDLPFGKGEDPEIIIIAPPPLPEMESEESPSFFNRRRRSAVEKEDRLVVVKEDRLVVVKEANPEQEEIAVLGTVSQEEIPGGKIPVKREVGHLRDSDILNRKFREYDRVFYIMSIFMVLAGVGILIQNMVEFPEQYEFLIFW